MGGVATVLFALGGAAQLGGAPAGLWWALYLACYATGGLGARRWPGCARCGTRLWTSTC